MICENIIKNDSTNQLNNHLKTIINQNENSSNILLLNSNRNDSMVQSVVRKTHVEENHHNHHNHHHHHNPSVIMTGSQTVLGSRIHHGSSPESPLQYSNLSSINETIDRNSPIRFSQLPNSNSYQNLNNNNSNLNNENSVINNNNNNHNYNWPYDLSLDLRHKPADCDKELSEKQQNHQHQDEIIGNSEIEIESRIVEANNNQTNSNNNFGDIQTAVDHTHQHQNQHHISSDSAVMSAGLLTHYQTINYVQNNLNGNSSHHSLVGGVTTTSTIDEVIANTLKDENCIDDSHQYLTLNSVNDLQNLKENSYNNHNNSTSSGGESRSPSGFSNEEFDSNFQNLTPLTSVNRSSVMYSSPTNMQGAEHPIHGNTYETLSGINNR